MDEADRDKADSDEADEHRVDDPDGGIVEPPAPRSARSAAPTLAAAMLAVGEIIEPEKTRAEIVQTDDRPEDDEDDLDLDFGHLPPV